MSSRVCPLTVNPTLGRELTLLQSNTYCVCVCCVKTHFLSNGPYNRYIPQMEQHEPEGQMLFHLGNVTYCWMLSLATHCHTHYHLHPFYFVLFKFKVLVAKQHPTNTHTHSHTHAHTGVISGNLHVYVPNYTLVFNNFLANNAC